MTHKERPWLTILKFVEMGTVGYIFLMVIWPKLRTEPYRDENIGKTYPTLLNSEKAEFGLTILIQ